MNRQEILDKAKTINEKREKLEEFRDTCINAKICPMCGASLEEKKSTFFNPTYQYVCDCGRFWGSGDSDFGIFYYGEFKKEV